MIVSNCRIKLSFFPISYIVHTTSRAALLRSLKYVLEAIWILSQYAYCDMQYAYRVSRSHMNAKRQKFSLVVGSFTFKLIKYVSLRGNKNNIGDVTPQQQHNHHNHGRRRRKWSPRASQDALRPAPMHHIDRGRSPEQADMFFVGIEGPMPLKTL